MISQSLSVIIPAYNEAGSIKQAVYSVHEFLRETVSDFEIIVVNDGSIDGTMQVLTACGELELVVINNGINLGKGRSIKKGVAAASKDYILFCDADLSTPLAELYKFFDYIAKGYDIVIASRAMPDSNVVRYQNFLRRSMGKFFNCLVQSLLLRGIKDTQCGFKLFRSDIAKRIFSCQRIDRFCFDAEILYIARRAGARIKETGVTWLNRRASRVAIVRDSWNMFADLFVIKMNAVNGLYD